MTKQKDGCITTPSPSPEGLLDQLASRHTYSGGTSQREETEH